MKRRPNLESLFGEHGQALAEVYRKHLAKAVLGTPAQQAEAQKILRNAADRTAEKLRADSGKWIGSDYFELSVTAGGKRASKDIGIRFGGPNQQLLDRMAFEASYDLVKAADSTRPFLQRLMRKSQAYASEHITPQGLASVRATGSHILEENFKAAIAQGALESEHSREIAKRILKMNRLEEGDKVLLLNGQQWGAKEYASLLAETRKSEAENLAYADTIQSQGYEFIETSAHGGVTPGDICEFLQGNVWSLTENNSGIPMLPPEYGLPPWHPHCGHTFAVWIPELNGGASAIEDWVRMHKAQAPQLEAWRSESTGTLRTMQPKNKN